MQTRRRSLYRAPGTSSSPDLATLVRKAKERGGVVPQVEKRAEPPLPVHGGASRLGVGPSRPRPSTSAGSSPSVSASSATGIPVVDVSPVVVRPSKLGPRELSSPSSEWVMASPRTRSGSTKDRDSSDKDKVCFSLSLPLPLPLPFFLLCRLGAEYRIRYRPNL
jgi:hypothetical protein